jgi:hypothetical protein
MPGVIVPFVSLPEKSARENLAAFITHARRLGYFHGQDPIPWQEMIWDLRSKVATRNNSRTLVLHFNTMESGGMVKRSKRVPLPEPFVETVKALVAVTIPTGKMSAPYRRLMALRAVEQAFRELARPADITLLNHAVLDRAAIIILGKGNGNDNASWAAALAQVAAEVSNKRLSAIPLSWKSPAPPHRNQSRSQRVQENGGSAIREKLPHIKCVLDLALVFQTAERGADMITTAWFVFAMFAPSRVSEILTLPLARETEADSVYGLAWRPSKGGEPMTKFATTEEWADVARTAVARLRKLGEPARLAAAWYTEHPEQLYLPSGYEHLRGQGVTEREVFGILGVGDGRFNNFTLSRIIKPSRKTTRDPARTFGRVRTRLYEFESLEHWVLDHLPDGFPWADRKFGLLAKDALFCVPRHTMRANSASQVHVPELINANHIHADLNDLVSTIFVRHDLRNPTTGEHWKLNSHQPRHFLNTLAQSKHLSQALIAFWSGRKRVDQNDWYNQLPPEAYIEMYVALGEAAPRQIKAVGPLADKVVERARRELITPEEAMRVELGSIHVTRFGLCRHNYALTPCPKDKNCIGCGENTFIKGDVRHLAEARDQLTIAERAVALCLAAIAAGESGVEDWLRKHQEKMARWSLAIKLMLDPSIEDGTLITLPPPNVSQTKAGLSLRIREAEQTTATIDEMKDMLGVAAAARTHVRSDSNTQTKAAEN